MTFPHLLYGCALLLFHLLPNSAYIWLHLKVLATISIRKYQLEISGVSGLLENDLVPQYKIPLSRKSV